MQGSNLNFALSAKEAAAFDPSMQGFLISVTGFVKVCPLGTLKVSFGCFKSALHQTVKATNGRSC